MKVNRDMLNGGIVLLVMGFVLLQALPLFLPVNIVTTSQQQCYGSYCVQVPAQTDANATLRGIASVAFSAFELIGVIMIMYSFAQPHLESAKTA